MKFWRSWAGLAMHEASLSKQVEKDGRYLQEGFGSLVFFYFFSVECVSCLDVTKRSVVGDP